MRSKRLISKDGGAHKGAKKCTYIAEQTQGCVLFQSKRMIVVVDIWRCLVWSMLLVMRALDLVSGISCHWQWTGSIFIFLVIFLWGVAWWRLLSWISIADRWYQPSEMWASYAIVSERVESLNPPTLDFHLGTTYQTLQSKICHRALATMRICSIHMDKFTGTTYLRPSWTIFHWALQKVLRSFLEFRF